MQGEGYLKFYRMTYPTASSPASLCITSKVAVSADPKLIKVVLFFLYELFSLRPVIELTSATLWCAYQFRKQALVGRTKNTLSSTLLGALNAAFRWIIPRSGSVTTASQVYLVHSKEAIAMGHMLKKRGVLYVASVGADKNWSRGWVCFLTSVRRSTGNHSSGGKGGHTTLWKLSWGNTETLSNSTRTMEQRSSL